MFLSQNMKKLLLHAPKILLDTAENAMGMATSQSYLWKPVLCLSRPGVSRMNSTPMFPWQNVTLTTHQEGKLTDHSKNIDNIAANTVEN